MGRRFKPDGRHLIIRDPVKLKSAEIDSFHDHRIAMSFAIASLVADKESKIINANCANVSFPGFYELLNEVTIA